jgi:hypothetical protein
VGSKVLYSPDGSTVGMKVGSKVLYSPDGSTVGMKVGSKVLYSPDGSTVGCGFGFQTRCPVTLHLLGYRTVHTPSQRLSNLKIKVASIKKTAA